MNAEFAKTKLPLPFSVQLKSNFEQDLYKATNLFRMEPEKFVFYIKNARSIFSEDFKDLNRAYVDQVCNIIKQQEKLSFLKLNDEAILACRSNNDRIK